MERRDNKFGMPDRSQGEQEIDEYAVCKNLHGAPAFVWWVHHVLKKHILIIATTTKRYHKRTRKSGIEVPNSWDDCMLLDMEYGDTMWQDALRKEMKNVSVALKVMNGDKAIPPIYQEIHSHMIFDVKMEDFIRNAHFVAGGHTTDTPHDMMYASVVSLELARIALALAALNDLDVNMADIKNAYLTVPITEKVWTVLDPDFGDDAEKCALIVRALYGLQSVGAAFGNHFIECTNNVGWKPCRADRDLWMKAETHPDDGMLY
jgi:hypothetical protein